MVASQERQKEDRRLWEQACATAGGKEGDDMDRVMDSLLEGLALGRRLRLRLGKVKRAEIEVQASSNIRSQLEGRRLHKKAKSSDRLGEYHAGNVA